MMTLPEAPFPGLSASAVPRKVPRGEMTGLMIETTACPGVLAEIFALLDKKKVIPFSTATQVGPDGNRLEIETGVLEESTIMALLPALRRMPAVRNAQLRRSVPAPAPTVCAEI